MAGMTVLEVHLLFSNMLAWLWNRVCRNSVLKIGCPGSFSRLCIKIELYNQQNEEVIRCITAVNVAEIVEEELVGNSLFWFGSWQQFKNIISSYKFDLIIGSEILYDPSNDGDILDILDKCSESIIASKNFYFGLTGNLYDFIDQATSSGYQVDTEVVTSTEIPRSILRLTKSQPGLNDTYCQVYDGKAGNLFHRQEDNIQYLVAHIQHLFIFMKQMK